MQFFKHMTNMRFDRKIQRIKNKYGLRGYGLYNHIIESIAESLCTKKPIPDLEDTANDIAIEYGEDTVLINEIMAFMLNQGLFELDEITGRILCHKVYKFLDQSQTRSKEIKGMIDRYKNNVSECPRQIETVSDNHDRIEENRIDIEKNIYGELNNVLLTEKEYNKLIKDYGEKIILKYINSLSLYEKIDNYTDHNKTIRKWLNKDDIPKQQIIEIPENKKINLNEPWI